LYKGRVVRGAVLMSMKNKKWWRSKEEAKKGWQWKKILVALTGDWIFDWQEQWVRNCWSGNGTRWFLFLSLTGFAMVTPNTASMFFYLVLVCRAMLSRVIGRHLPWTHIDTQWSIKAKTQLVVSRVCLYFGWMYVN
jgi:hypothetical protein